MNRSSTCIGKKWCLFAEKQIALNLSIASDNDGVHDTLLSVANDVLSNIDSHYVERVSRRQGISWRRFEEDAVEYMDLNQFVQLFRADGEVEGIHDDQWSRMYERIKEHDFESGDVMARRQLAQIHVDFRKKWLSQCNESRSLSFSLFSSLYIFRSRTNILFAPVS